MKTRFNACFFVVFILAGLALILGNLGAWYTMTAVPFALSIALVLWFLNPKWLTHFIFTYLVCLIPFLIVNGVLTGAVTQGPIVWYHPTGFSGIRMVTIPVEDLFYNFDLLLGTVIFYNLSKNLFLSQK
jgi:lycopene cyclase domain-containing protein